MSRVVYAMYRDLDSANGVVVVCLRGLACYTVVMSMGVGREET